LTPEACGADGQWVPAEIPCAKACSGGLCVESCIPGDFRCNENIPEFCDDQGGWQVNGKACDPCVGCDSKNGKCIVGPPLVCGMGEVCGNASCVCKNPVLGYFVLVGEFPVSVVAADFDNDGTTDLALANYGDYEANVDGSVSVLLNNGDGTFAPKADYPALGGTGAIAAEDFDGDGVPDLAVTSYGLVGVLLNNGDGTFAPRVDYEALVGPGSIAVADFDNNGKLDLVVAGDIGFKSGKLGQVAATGNISPIDWQRVVLLLNSGKGFVESNVDECEHPTSVAASDFNGDGKPDLAVTCEVVDTVNVLLNKGDGSFAFHVAYQTGSAPMSVAADDFNGDGKPDLAVALNVGHVVSVWLNNGDGTFAPNIDYETDYDPISVVAADLNGDGKPDLVVANEASSTVNVLLNNGNGTFASKISLPTDSAPTSVAVGDLNGDGKADLAVANKDSNTVTVLFQNCLP
jgi:hypothetical protein